MANKAFVVSVVLLIVTAVLITFVSSRGTPIVVATNLEKLPMEIMGYTATEDSFSKAVYEELNADLHIYRHYNNGHGQQIDLYIGYYGTAKGGRTPHNPNACFSSAGWSIMDSHALQLTDEGQLAAVNLNYMRIKKGEEQDVVLHWYQSAGDKVLSSGFQQNIQRFKGRVFHNRNDGAFVRLSISGSNTKHSLALLQSFSEILIPLISKNWPEEK